MRLNIAIVGASGHLGYVTDDLLQHPEVRVTACAPSYPNEDLSRIKALGSEIRRYSDWRVMLDQERLDAVVACGRLDVNGSVSIAALRRGLHVISEKPAALGLEQVAELRSLLADGDRVYALMLAMRYEPALYTARRLVAQGVIGDPLLISAQKSYRWGVDRPEWYADADKYGSTMAWVGIHAFDFARWVSGIEYATVAASHANLSHPERPACQDVATVISELSNGGVATFTLDFLRPSGAETHGDDRLRVAGSRGILEVCDQGRLQVLTRETSIRAWPLDTVPRTFLGDFIAAVDGSGELLIDAESGLTITEFALRAAIAADTGQKVEL